MKSVRFSREPNQTICLHQKTAVLENCENMIIQGLFSCVEVWFLNWMLTDERLKWLVFSGDCVLIQRLWWGTDSNAFRQFVAWPAAGSVVFFLMFLGLSWFCCWGRNHWSLFSYRSCIYRGFGVRAFIYFRFTFNLENSGIKLQNNQFIINAFFCFFYFYLILLCFNNLYFL